MADVELDDLGDRRDRLHVVVGEAVAGVHFEPEVRRALRARCERRSSSRACAEPLASA